MTGELGQHVSVPPVVTRNLAGEKAEMGEPLDISQGPEVMEEDHQPIQNPELEANEAQVMVTEEERKKVQPSISTCGTQLNMSLDENTDSRSVYIGNVDCITPAEADSEGNLVKSHQEKMEQPLIDPKQSLPVEVYDINQCQVLCTFDLGSLQPDPFVPGKNSEKPSERDPKKDSKKAAKEDPKKDSKKASNEDLKKDTKNAANEDPKNLEKPSEKDPKKDSKNSANGDPEKEANEDPKKDSKITAKKDPKKDSKKPDVVSANDARPEESIIDCVNLLDEFEASLSGSNSSGLQNQDNLHVTEATKLFDLNTLCGHPLTIYQNDLDSLQGRSYVTEGAVEFFLDVMFQEIDVRSRKDVHILSTAVFASLRGRCEKKIERSLNLKENIFDKNFIIIPICNNSHWFIAVATRFNH